MSVRWQTSDSWRLTISITTNFHWIVLMISLIFHGIHLLLTLMITVDAISMIPLHCQIAPIISETNGTEIQTQLVEESLVTNIISHCAQEEFISLHVPILHRLFLDQLSFVLVIMTLCQCSFIRLGGVSYHDTADRALTFWTMFQQCHAKYFFSGWNCRCSRLRRICLCLS